MIVFLHLPNQDKGAHETEFCMPRLPYQSLMIIKQVQRSLFGVLSNTINPLLTN